MTNIIDFDEYALAKDPENEWAKKSAELIRPFLRWNHLDTELEIAAARHYRALNGTGDKDWTYEVDCYLGVPDHIGLFLEPSHSDFRQSKSSVIWSPYHLQLDLTAHLHTPDCEGGGSRPIPQY